MVPHPSTARPPDPESRDTGKASGSSTSRNNSAPPSIAKTLKNALRRVLLLAMVVVALRAWPPVNEPGDSIEAEFSSTATASSRRYA